MSGQLILLIEVFLFHLSLQKYLTVGAGLGSASLLMVLPTQAFLYLGVWWRYLRTPLKLQRFWIAVHAAWLVGSIPLLSFLGRYDPPTPIGEFVISLWIWTTAITLQIGVNKNSVAQLLFSKTRVLYILSALALSFLPLFQDELWNQLIPIFALWVKWMLIPFLPGAQFIATETTLVIGHAGSGIGIFLTSVCSGLGFISLFFLVFFLWMLVVEPPWSFRTQGAVFVGGTGLFFLINLVRISAYFLVAAIVHLLQGDATSALLSLFHSRLQWAFFAATAFFFLKYCTSAIPANAKRLQIKSQ